MAAATGWGALAAASLVIGALLALVRSWPDRVVGLVLSFGAGALISAVSFELAEEGIELAGGKPVGIGLGAGALTYFALDRLLEPVHPSVDHGHDMSTTAGIGLALGAFLDGIPEQLVLGIGLAGGAGVSVSLLVAIFVSNLPESIGSASEMTAHGRAPRAVIGLWVAVAAVCTLATIAGYALADAVSDEFKAGVDGFAAGALLVMLVDSMIPEAARKAGRPAGLVTVLGFAVAAGLSTMS
jgi:zinc transporter, ZIP family